MSERSNVSRVFHRQLKASYPTASAGSGAYLEDSTGKRYLDASGGAAVSCLGHGHPRVIEAVKAQMDKLAFAHTAFFTSDPAEQLADKLIRRAPEGYGRVYFVSGGSEANEAALKLARQLQVERGESGRDHFISRRQSYHGNTLGALAVSGNPGRRRLYEPLLTSNVRFAEPCYAYRHKGLDETEREYGLRAARSLESEIEQLGSNRVIAFIAETVVGATLGAVPPVPGYFREVRRICDHYGVLMILDEVMCGMGRTGTLFACEQDGVVPDMITCAKGLGGGYQPIGALLVRKELADRIEAASGTFEHGHTYIGHPAACAGALEVQKVIEEDGLLDRVRKLAAGLDERLQAALGQKRYVGDMRGRGLFRGIEIVEDKLTAQPHAADAGIAGKIKAAAMAQGLICYPGSGTIDGEAGNHVLLAPPYIIEEGQLDELVEKLAKSLETALG